MNNSVMFADYSGNWLTTVLIILLSILISTMLFAVTYKGDGFEKSHKDKKHDKDAEENNKSNGVNSNGIKESAVIISGGALNRNDPYEMATYFSQLTNSFFGHQSKGNYGIDISSTGRITYITGSRFSYDGKDLVDIALDMNIW